jgi:ankyrin repeat protein
MVKLLVCALGRDEQKLLPADIYEDVLDHSQSYPELFFFRFRELRCDADTVLLGKIYGRLLARAASKARDLSVVKYLIYEAQVDVDTPVSDYEYGSALSAAAGSGKLAMVKFLVCEAHGNVDLVVTNGWAGNALVAAARNNELDIVRYLIHEANATVDLVLQSGDYGTALVAAAAGAHPRRYAHRRRYLRFLVTSLATTKALVEEGQADVNLAVPTGYYANALVAAVARGAFDIAKFLIQEAHANVNLPTQSTSQCTALGYAILRRKDRIANLLIQAGANVTEEQGSPFGSPLAAAAATNRPDLIKSLIEAGADPNQPISSGCWPTRFFSASYAPVCTLAAWGKCGSALATAAYFGHLECVKILIELRASVDLILESGTFQTALQAAEAVVSEDEIENYQKLHNGNDEDYELSDDDEDEMEKALRRGKAEVAEILRQHSNPVT